MNLPCFRAISSRGLIKIIDEKIDYIPNNPVEAGLVFIAEDYWYSSAVDYSGEKGVLNNVIVVK
ncbi:hypothetical protein [Sunxiuqinia rutila]|uniref:hypothetical protein n=1 Tax=Sunxiuqinia rutila TaxID=1397841 RepID=UPI003D36E686